LIGGNGFIGRFVVAALQAQGHTVAVFYRGTTAAPAGVDEIRGDHNQLAASAQELKRFAPDVVIDLVLSSGAQADDLMKVFRGATLRVVMLSSMDVYRAVAFRTARRAGRSKTCRSPRSRSYGEICILIRLRTCGSCVKSSPG